MIEELLAGADYYSALSDAPFSCLTVEAVQGLGETYQGHPLEGVFKVVVFSFLVVDLGLPTRVRVDHVFLLSDAVGYRVDVPSEHPQVVSMPFKYYIETFSWS
jgi:hypothetical protein